MDTIQINPVGKRVIIKPIVKVSEITGQALEDDLRRGEVIGGEYIGKIIYYRNSDRLTDELLSVDIDEILAMEE